MSKIVVSGGFDPIHIGHVRMIQDASKLGELTVILNTDDFLMNKKGFVFMPFDERKEILENIKGVSKVFDCIDKDQTVCETIKLLRPDIYCNGGDRFEDNIPEKELCEGLGIEMKFNVGGEKIQSSSWLVGRFV